MSAGLPKGLMHCCLSGRLENSLLTRLRVSLHTLEFIMMEKIGFMIIVDQQNTPLSSLCYKCNGDVRNV